MADRNIALDQFLTFTLGREIIALDISRVREVLELTDISKIPRTPVYMRGVINLRGHAVPVMDMRQKLEMSPAEDTIDTCIIIVEVDFGNDTVVLGALVDSVREVFEISAEAIEPAPKMGAAVKTEFIKGMSRQNDNFVVMVDINAIFSEAELEAVSRMEDTPSAQEKAA